MYIQRGCGRSNPVKTRRSACQILFLAAFLFAAVIFPGLSPAQLNPSTRNSAGLELLFLGTNGGPGLYLEQSESSTLLIVDGRPYLIDCGIGTIRRMLRANIQSRTIRTIFFTHLHSDHDLGLADVMANDFGINSSTVVDIYGPPQTRALVKAAFNYIRIPNAVFAAERPGNPALVNPFKAHEIQGPGLIYKDDKVRVTAVENTHYALMPANLREKMKSYSYRFETPEGVVVFTGDTGPSDAVMQLAKGADVLVSESSGATPALLSAFVRAMAQKNHWSAERAKDFMAHMTQEHLNLEQIGEMATQARVASVILSHDGPGDSSTYPAEVKKYFGGPVFAPVDLDRFCITAPSSGKSSSREVHPCR